MSSASLRLITINNIVCGVSGTYMSYPMFFRCFGYVGGLLYLFAVLVLNYLTSLYILQASSHYQELDFNSLIRKALGPVARRVANYTLLLDYFSSYVIGILMVWNNLVFLLFSADFLDPEAIESAAEPRFNPYAPQLLTIRFAMTVLVFIGLYRLFLLEKMESFAFVFKGYFCVLGALLVYLVYDFWALGVRYRAAGTHSTHLFSLDQTSLKFGVILLSAFYSQPNLLVMKSELPESERGGVERCVKISYGFFAVIGTFFGLVGYFFLGDRHTSVLFLYRRGFADMPLQWLHKGFILVISLPILLYLSFFNLSLRQYFKANFGAKRKLVTSVLPLFLSLLLAFAYPDIVNVLGYNGIFVCAFNGYVFPGLMKIQMMREKGVAKWKIGLVALMVVLVLAVSTVSFVQMIKGV